MTGSARPPTLLDAIGEHAARAPHATAFTWLSDRGATETLTYGELTRRAQLVAARLRQSTKPGDRALLLFGPGLDFVWGFLGCLWAGVVAVPAYPPRNKKHHPRLDAILRDAEPRVLLVGQTGASKLDEWLADAPAIERIDTSTIDLTSHEQPDAIHLPRPGDLALLQYTSGSTSTPKGVTVTHANLAHNSEALRQAFHLGAHSVSVSWLPSFHDMGLVDGVLQPLYTGFPAYLMAPSSFIQRPATWLEAISRYGATHCGGPNFGFEACIQGVTDAQMDGLDLSRWETAYNGAEPVRRDTLDAFAAKFARCGFTPKQFFPCYGLAEGTLIVTGPNVDAEPGIAPDESGRLFVGCGSPVIDTEVLIVDGEICVKGPSVATGYWNRPEATAETFGGGYLRTGDLGFFRDGELFVAGRIKDLVIVRGRNHYPQDLEATASAAHAALDRSLAAAFSVEHEDEERLVVVQEVPRTEAKKIDTAAVMSAIRSAIVDEHDVDPWDIVLVSALSLPKTSSGKLQRGESRRRYLAGEFKELARLRTARSDVHGATLSGSPERSGSLDVAHWIRNALAKLLGIRADQIDLTKPFASFGVDSVTAVRLSGELQEWLGRPVPPTVAYDYPTIEKLAAHLARDPERVALHTADAEQVAPRAKKIDADEPIAIVGIGCRVPGARGADEFWRLLRDGVDGIRDIPAGRWSADHFDPQPGRAGKLYSQRGGFLDEIDTFDAAFFGISPNEADRMDPQQRLLLETVWEAFEDAGIPPPQLEGSETGVFVGISTSDYRSLQFASADQIDHLAGTGNAASISANRISYLLDLQGPSIAVDTACSSSLLSIHLACESLRRGECSVAVAGGVNLMLSPELTVAFSQARMLSPDGQCKSFDADANGYVRGEGCGMVVLKPLRDAVRDGDRVAAVILATATNQDGRTNGLTAPNGLSQQRVLRKALERSGLASSDVQYVEAHGTGTPLGDPIEIQALCAIYGADRAPTQPLYVGSVKTNIGHLEAAAGVMAVIKTALALRERTIPAHLHFAHLNPAIDLGAVPVTIPTTSVAWPDADRPAAGVSSFGFGGTNVHALLAAAPTAGLKACTTAASKADSRSASLQACRPLLLSAKSDAALRLLAERYRDLLRTDPRTSLADLGFTALGGRARFAHRLGVAGGDASDVANALNAWLRLPATANTSRTRPRIAFLYTGQGSQYAGMGASLYRSEPVFRDVIDRCAAFMRERYDVDLVALLVDASAETNTALAQTHFTQPALYAIECALTSLWRSWGIEPDAVLGHSVGEFAAAWAAGVFDLEDGLALIAERGRLMDERCEPGRMAAIFASIDRVEPLARAAGVEIAAYNAPGQIVVSGLPDAVAQVVHECGRANIPTFPLTSTRAFHSALMEPALAEFEHAASRISARAPQLPWISNVSGDVMTQAPDAAYWRTHARVPVRFADGVRALDAQGIDVFIEIGPAPVLLSIAKRIVQAGTQQWLPSLERDEERQIANSVAALHVAGFDFDARALFPTARRIAAPAYPFARERHWFTKHDAPATVVSNAQVYEVAWERLPTRPSTANPSPADLRDDIATREPTLRAASGMTGYPAALEALENAAVEYARTALARVPDDRIAPRHRRLASRLRSIVATHAAGAPAAPLREIASQHPEIAHEARILERCGARLADVLTGAVDPLHLLFPGGDLGAAASLYSDAAVAQLMNGQAAVALERYLQQCDRRDRVRILEVGAGTGGLTTHLLPVIAAWGGDCDFVFTDVSPLFLEQARSRFAAYPFIEYRLLDVENADEVEKEHCDLIIAANAVHAVARLTPVLHSLHAMLSPGGQLWLLEGVRPQVWLDMTFGLTDGWWKAADGDGRSDYPLLSVERWASMLASSGFASTTELSASSDVAPYALIAAMRAAPQNVLLHLDSEPTTDATIAEAQAVELSSKMLAALREVSHQKQARLWVVTRGAHGGAINPASVLWGLGKTAALEFPDHWGGLIDLDPDGNSADEERELAAELAHPSNEDQQIWRRDGRWAPRLSVAAPTSAPWPAPRGGVLITGGTGALGLQAALGLARSGYRHLYLMSRTARTPVALDELRALGATVHVVAGDAANPSDVDRILLAMDLDGVALQGIVHAAGVPHAKPLVENDATDFETVYRAKVRAPLVLLDRTRQRTPEFFVLFSSMVSLWGAKGQGVYTAGNHFLDDFAAACTKSGIHALAINWGPVSGGGMVPADALARVASMGVRPLPLSSISGLLTRVAPSISQAAIVDIDWNLFRAHFETRGPKPFFSRVGTRAIEQPREAAAARDVRLKPYATRTRIDDLAGFIRGEIASILGYATADRVDSDRGFFEIGLDSLTIIQLKARLEKALGITLPATIALEYPTVTALARHLQPSATTTPKAAASTGTPAEEPIAIVGIGCRFPGGVADADSFWTLLRDGVDAVGPLPANRWDDGPALTGGFLDRVDMFDAGFFGVSAREATKMDPQHRLLLHVAFDALENAGAVFERSAAANVGVFVGVSASDYARRLTNNGDWQDIDAYYATGNALNAAAGRVSYLFGFRGPAIAIDTACSSSLVAIRLACQSLRSGECDAALAGGVNLILSPETTASLNKANVLSPTGRCRTFDASADGMGRAEGCGLVLLKPLSRAIADHDRIYAVIRSAVVNQDGASGGFTVPSRHAQESLIRQALDRADVPPSSVDYIEAHGTGTPLGDPIEARALAAVFADSHSREHPLRIGSVKTNFGHTESASGVAGLIKTALSLHRDEIAPQIHFEQPSPHIDWAHLPLQVVTRRTAWPRGERPRRAGVSSFGLSGTNAHVLLEEAPATRSTPADPAHEFPVVVSAKTDAALTARRRQLAAFLRANPDVDLRDVSYTLSARRLTLQFSWIAMATSMADALRKLDDPSLPGADMSGIDWPDYWRGREGHLVSLPAYPFEYKSYWKDLVRHVPVAAAAREETMTEQADVQAEVVRIVARLLEEDPSAIDPARPFLEMGADSIVLMEAIKTIEQRFGVEITIRQMFESLTNIVLLAAFIAEHRKLSTTEDTEKTSSISSASSASSVVESSTDWQRAVDHIQKQLDVLKTQAPLPSLPEAPSSNFWKAEAPERAALTPAQQAHVDRLVARYVAKTKGSKASEEANRPVFADMRTAIGFRIDTKEMSYPIVAARSNGATFWDIDGNQYVDMCMGFGVAFFGHQPSFVVRAIEQQLHDGIQVGPQSKDAAEVARLICELTGMERVTFCNSGTEAVMTAIRIARAATGKQRIVTFTGSYHGHSDATLALAKNAGRNPVSVPMAPGVSPDAVKDTLVLPWDLAKSLEIIEANADSLAAVLVEPVQSRRPGLHPREFLRALRDLTTRRGIPLIFDEMITGFRIHPGGAQAHFGIEADITTYGKLIGGGMPLGVVAARGRFLDRIDGGQWQYGDNSYPAVERTFYAGTFCKHPLSMAAARAVLTELVRRGPALQHGLNKTTADFVASVNAIFSEEHVPLNIVNFGSLMRFNVAGNFTYLYQPLEMDLFCHHLIERGIYIWEGRTLFLSTEHTPSDLDTIRRAVRESVREMKAGGFFTGPTTRLPLTEAQRDLWVLAQMGPDGANAYQETIAVDVNGAIEPAHFESALRWLIDRHEALRIAIDPDGQEQEVRADAVVDVRFDDLRLEADSAAALDAHMQAEAAEPFDLQQGPLVRARVWTLSPSRTIVALYSHHIVADGWTMGILIEELSAAYAAIKDGRRRELAPAPRYSDYLKARAARLDSASAQTHRQYWKDALAAPLPALDLPLDHPRPPVKTFGAFRVVSTLPETMHASLKTLSASHGCTMFMTLLAGYAALLHRLAGAPSDITIGMPVSGRVDQDDATVAGFCTHMLPVRLRIDGEWTFGELLHRVRKAVLDAFDHQEWPFGRMLDDVEVDADLSRTPVFTTTFNLDRPIKLSSFGGASAQLMALPARFTTYDLACNVVIDGSSLIVSCDGNSDLWQPATTERWVAHYRSLLQAAAGNATLRVEELPLLDETARKRVLADWNNTNEPLPHVATIHQWIEEQAERTPDAEAVRCGTEGFTYAQLNARAEQLAGSLRAHGIGRGDLVGVSLPRRFDLVATLFAVLKTGAAYVPLDPRFPVARLRRMIAHSGMRLVFTDAETQAAIEPALSQGVELLRVEDAHGWRATDTAHRLPSGDDTAYVMYTSASTGEPKGVVITHRSVINLLSSMARRLEPAAADAWLAVTTVSFDISVLEIFLPLVSGFKLVLADDETSRDGRLIAEALEREQITLLQMTPAGWRLLLESGWTGNPRLAMVCGGEALPIELARTLAPKGRVLWNVYGPTETTIWSTAGIVDVAALAGRSSVPIGQPLANTQLYVLDGNGHVQPTGVPGELFIGGAGLAVGYHRDEMITLERFLPNPLGGPSPRLYRTGDLARWLPGGSMEFLGRLDQQVKIRGFRIELGEIDAWLSRYPGVAEAVAHVRLDASGEQRLIAYFTAQPGATLADDDIRRHLSANLPEYMVPDVIAQLDAMPRTPNGKVDRRSLPAIAPAPVSTSTAAPLTPTEQAIAIVWQEMLQRPQVGADEDFLALGGNSLLAARLATRLSAAFQITLTLRALLEHRTVRRMAQLVESIQWAAASRKPAGASDEQVEITL